MKNKIEFTNLYQVMELLDFNKIESRLKDIVDTICECRLDLKNCKNNSEKKDMLYNIIRSAKAQARTSVFTKAIKELPNRKSYRIKLALRSEVYEELSECYEDEIIFINAL